MENNIQKKLDFDVARIETVNTLWQNEQFGHQSLDFMLSLAGDRLNHSYAATDQIINKAIYAIPIILAGIGFIADKSVKFIFSGCTWQAFLCILVHLLGAVSVCG